MTRCWPTRISPPGCRAAIAAGISYAARQGAQVIDLPLDPGQASADGTAGATAAAGGSAAEKAAIAYALRLGAVVVAPAGDDGAAGRPARTGPAARRGTAAPRATAAPRVIRGPTANAVNYPAAYPGVISVGSFNQAVIKSPFSVRQQYVTLTAAGQGVIAAAMPHGYAVMNSTSAASAIVAGIAALIKSQFPELTPAQVTQALKNGTVFRPAGKTGDGSGAGTADAARALAAAATIAGPGAQRAGAGAQPHVLPAAPPLPTFRQTPDLGAAGEGRDHLRGRARPVAAADRASWCCGARRDATSGSVSRSGASGSAIRKPGTAARNRSLPTSRAPADRGRPAGLAGLLACTGRARRQARAGRAAAAGLGAQPRA